MGCGILMDRKEIFYSKNGALIGTAFRSVEGSEDDLYPCVTLSSISHHVEANFGSKQFAFDMEGHR